MIIYCALHPAMSAAMLTESTYQGKLACMECCKYSRQLKKKK